MVVSFKFGISTRLDWVFTIFFLFGQLQGALLVGSLFTIFLLLSNFLVNKPLPFFPPPPFFFSLRFGCFLAVLYGPDLMYTFVSVPVWPPFLNFPPPPPFFFIYI